MWRNTRMCQKRIHSRSDQWQIWFRRYPGCLHEDVPQRSRFVPRRLVHTTTVNRLLSNGEVWSKLGTDRFTSSPITNFMPQLVLCRCTYHNGKEKNGDHIQWRLSRWNGKNYLFQAQKLIFNRNFFCKQQWINNFLLIS